MEASANQTEVLVRAYGDRAERMICHVIESGRAVVSRPGGTETISLPISLVFELDLGLAEKINQAVERNDTRRVIVAWKNAVPIRTLTTQPPID